MKSRPQKVVLTTSMLVLISTLLLESLSRIYSGLEQGEPFNWPNLAFRAVILGPIFLLITVWLTTGRRAFQQQRLDDCNVSHWKYAAEGALNVAVRYLGEHSSLQGRILRLRKKPRASVTQLQSFSSSSFTSEVDDDDVGMANEDLAETLTQANEFIDSVMVPLLGRKYVPQSKVTHLDCDFIEDLAKSIDSDRPAKRRDAASLQKNAGVGLLMSDSAQIPCGCGNDEPCTSLCFELKPKWGFLCTEATEWEVKRRVDRFTMHQQMKKTLDPKAEVSQYCPLELFHGGKEGILRSLNNLAKTPQNNLRLFVNGQLSFPNAQKGQLNHSLLACGSEQNELFEALTEVLTKEDILSRILKAQTIGPLNDIESVYPIYLEMERLGISVGDVHLGYNTTQSPSNPPTCADDYAEIVKRFLISCTARDCSVMITFSKCQKPLRQPLGKCQEGQWSYEITVVDLDAKPITKMHHYYSVDQEIARTYTDYIKKTSIPETKEDGYSTDIDLSMSAPATGFADKAEMKTSEEEKTKQ